MEKPECGSDLKPVSQQSIFVIGMKGVGKTTIGKSLAELLSWTFIDLDQALEKQSGMSCPEFVHQFNWEEFRRREVAVLKEAMTTKPQRHVISCGGGIVETEEARYLLKKWHTDGIVLLIHRDTEQVMKSLKADGTRSDYMEETQNVYRRRKPWFEECSNLFYLSPHSQHPEEISKHLREFVSAITQPNDS
jgi:pentafunctional AROM polypeptide